MFSEAILLLFGALTRQTLTQHDVIRRPLEEANSPSLEHNLDSADAQIQDNAALIHISFGWYGATADMESSALSLWAWCKMFCPCRHATVMNQLLLLGARPPALSER